MSLNSDSKYYDTYYDHVLNKRITIGTLAIVFDIINDISDRRGLKNEWCNIDGDIQDEIIDTWRDFIDKNNTTEEYNWISIKDNEAQFNETVLENSDVMIKFDNGEILKFSTENWPFAEATHFNLEKK